MCGPRGHSTASGRKISVRCQRSCRVGRIYSGPMTERAESRTARRSEAAETQDGPVFVDPSGRRRRRARMFSGLALGAIAVYLGLVATAFLGGPDIVTPLLPKPPASANDAARQVPAIAPSPTASPFGGARGVDPAHSTCARTVAHASRRRSRRRSHLPRPSPRRMSPARARRPPGKTNTPEPPQRP